MNLNVNEWKDFFINRTNNRCGLFEIQPCKCGNAGNLDDGDDLYYIGAKKNDNGIMKKVKAEENLISKGNGIIFICDGEGSVGYTNYIPMDFIGSTTISVGYDNNLNAINGMFLVTILDMEKYKFSYGRKYRQHINEIKIKLPICMDKNNQPIIDKTYKYSSDGYIPDFKWMENYIKSLHHKPITTNIPQKIVPKLNIEDWREFQLGTFCNISIAKSDDLGSLDLGKIPFIGRTNINNGLQSYVSSNKINKGNCITISMVGTNIALWQEDSFAASQNIAVIRNEKFNKFTAMFICSLINFEMSGKFSYGRTVNKSDVTNMLLKLPICKDKNNYPIIDPTYQYSPEGYVPDWEWMENYIKSLPYSDKL